MNEIERLRNEALEVAAQTAIEVAQELSAGEGEVYIAVKIADAIRNLKS